MSTAPRLRFGVVASLAAGSEEWVEKARRAESLGSSSLLVPDDDRMLGLPLDAGRVGGAAQAVVGGGDGHRRRRPSRSGRGLDRAPAPAATAAPSRSERAVRACSSSRPGRRTSWPRPSRPPTRGWRPRRRWPGWGPSRPWWGQRRRGAPPCSAGGRSWASPNGRGGSGGGAGPSDRTAGRAVTRPGWREAPVARRRRGAWRRTAAARAGRDGCPDGAPSPGRPGHRGRSRLAVVCPGREQPADRPSGYGTALRRGRDPADPEWSLDEGSPPGAPEPWAQRVLRSGRGDRPHRALLTLPITEPRS